MSVNFAFLGNPLTPVFQFVIKPIVPPNPLSILPNSGAQGQTLTATILGTLFAAGTTFTLGEIVPTSTIINSSSQATITFTIGTSATLGFRNLVATNIFGTGTLVNAFTVLNALFQFPQSGLDVNDMAVLGISTLQTLYYDYGNTEAFYIQLRPSSDWSSGFGPDFTPSTKPLLFKVSPQFAQRWYGTQSPQVVFNPFNYNQNRPSSLT